MAGPATHHAPVTGAPPANAAEGAVGSDPLAPALPPRPARWARAAAAAAPWQPDGARLVVVVPHPDDEVLATAGLLLAQRRLGAPVCVVAVTDGGAAYPDVGSAALASRRAAEQADALGTLGVTPARTVRLGLPDGGLPGLVDDLAAALLPIVEHGDLLVAPWDGDHHADHVACARAARAVAARRRTPLLGSLFWAYHHTAPPTAGRLLRLDLPAADTALRWAALQAHRSQLPTERPDCILTPEVLGPLGVGHEVYVRVAP